MLQQFQLEEDPCVQAKGALLQRNGWCPANVGRDAAACLLDISACDHVFLLPGIRVRDPEYYDKTPPARPASNPSRVACLPFRNLCLRSREQTKIHRIFSYLQIICSTKPTP